MKIYFIVNKRHDYFNLPKLREELGDRFEFYLIIENRYLSFLSEAFQSCLKAVFSVDQIDFESCLKVIDSSREKSDFRIVCTDEKSLMLSAKLRQHYNLTGARPHQYIPFSTKRMMKEILWANGIEVPRFVDFDGIHSEGAISEYHTYLRRTLHGDYVVKPLDGGASIDTAHIQSASNLKFWMEHSHHKEASFFAEEYIDGKMYFCDSFVVDGEIVFSEVSEYLFPCLHFCSGKPLGGFPLSPNHPLVPRILDLNRAVLQALSPPNGATHLECLIRKSHPLFLEIGPRPPGAAVVIHHEKNYGVNLYEQTLRAELGLVLDFEHKPNLYHSWIAFPAVPGIVQELNVPRLKSAAQWKWSVQKGDHILSYPRNINEGFIAHLSLHNPDYQELLEDIERIKTHAFY